MGIRVVDDAACAVVAVAGLADGADADEHVMIWWKGDHAAEALEIDVFAGRVGGDDRDMGMAVETDTAVLEEKMERGAVFANDVSPVWKWLAGSMADLVVEPCVFKNHRQVGKPFHLAISQDLAIPFKDFDGLCPDAFTINVLMKGEEIVVATNGWDFVLFQEIDAFSRSGAVADDVACAQHVVDGQAFEFGNYCLQSVNVAMYVAYHAYQHVDFLFRLTNILPNIWYSNGMSAAWNLRIRVS